MLIVFAIAIAIAWALHESAPTWRRHVDLWMAPAPESLPIPVEGVKPRALADTWGAVRDRDRKHQGIDIFAPRGTPVVSPVQGIVVGMGQDRLGGNVVRILGPGRQVHYFAHLDAFSGVKLRDWVHPGAVLGYVGTTGNARTTPPHLHYGIYAMGGPINPFPLLKFSDTDRGKRPRPNDG